MSLGMFILTILYALIRIFAQLEIYFCQELKTYSTILISKWKTTKDKKRATLQNKPNMKSPFRISQLPKDIKKRKKKKRRMKERNKKKKNK